MTFDNWKKHRLKQLVRGRRSSSVYAFDDKQRPAIPVLAVAITPDNADEACGQFVVICLRDVGGGAPLAFKGASVLFMSNNGLSGGETAKWIAFGVRLVVPPRVYYWRSRQ